MAGGAGDDTYYVDNAGDSVVEASGAGTDLVNSSIGYALGSNVENLTLTGSATINGYGNGLANTLTGNAGNNALNGAGRRRHDGRRRGQRHLLCRQRRRRRGRGEQRWDRPGQQLDRLLPSASNVENLTLTGAANINGYRQRPRQHPDRQRGQQRPERPGRAPTRWQAARAATPTMSTTPATPVVEASGAGTDLVNSSIGYAPGRSTASST